MDATYTHTLHSKPSVWCDIPSRTWKTSSRRNKSKNTFLLLTLRHQNSQICLWSTQKKWQVECRCNMRDHSGDYKGDVFPLKTSQLIRVQSSQQGSFLAPPMLWRCSYYTQPIAGISLATLQVDIILKWCVLPMFLWIIHCLQLSSLVCPVRYTWSFFLFLASSQSEGSKESVATAALLPYYVKILHAARLADDERDEPLSGDSTPISVFIREHWLWICYYVWPCCLWKA